MLVNCSLEILHGRLNEFQLRVGARQAPILRCNILLESCTSSHVAQSEGSGFPALLIIVFWSGGSWVARFAKAVSQAPENMEGLITPNAMDLLEKEAKS